MTSKAMASGSNLTSTIMVEITLRLSQERLSRLISYLQHCENRDAYGSFQDDQTERLGRDLNDLINQLRSI